jgi:hypothetical protein
MNIDIIDIIIDVIDIIVDIFVDITIDMNIDIIDMVIDVIDIFIYIIDMFMDFFDMCINIPHYKNNPLSLNKIYLDMAESIIDDIDLERNFQGVKKRLKDNLDSEFNDKNELKDLWINKFNATSTKEQKDELVLALLTIKKAKSFWKNIQPSEDVSILPRRFREDLSLAIARQFYAKQRNNPKYHIPYFLETVQKISENKDSR